MIKELKQAKLQIIVLEERDGNIGLILGRDPAHWFNNNKWRLPFCIESQVLILVILVCWDQKQKKESLNPRK